MPHRRLFFLVVSVSLLLLIGLIPTFAQGGTCASDDALCNAQAELDNGDLALEDEDCQQAIYDYSEAINFIGRNTTDNPEIVLSAFYGLGNSHQCRGDFNNARTNYDLAIRKAQELNLPLEEANIRVDLGHLFSAERRFRDALGYFEDASVIYLREGSDQYFPTLLLVGRTNVLLFNLDTAIVNFSEAFDAFEAQGRDQLAAQAAEELALIYQYLGLNNLALENFESALTLYRAAGDRLGEARSLAGQGDLFRQLNYTDALILLQESEDIQNSEGDVPGLTVTFNYLGEYYLQAGEARQAFEAFNRALRNAETLEIIEAVAQAYHGMARAAAASNFGVASELEMRNFYNFSIARYRDDLRDDRRRAQVHLSRALVAVQTGNQGVTGTSASSDFQTALSSMRRVNDNRGIVQVHIAQAEGAEQDNNLRGAIRAYEDAVRALPAAESPDLESIVNLGLGDVYLRLADMPSALERYQAAVDLNASLDNTLELSRSYTRLGEWYFRNGEYGRSLEALKQAQDAFNTPTEAPLLQTIIDAVQADMLRTFGLLYLDRGIYDDADINLNDALRLYQNGNNQNEMALTYIYLGDLEVTRGNFESANQNYRQARNIAEATSNSRIAGLAALGIGVYEAQFDTLGAREVRLVFDDAVDLLRRADDTRALQNTYLAQSRIALRDSNLSEANRLANQALQEARRTRDNRGQAISFLALASYHEAIRTSTTQAIRQYEQALALLIDLPDVELLASTRIAFGNLYINRYQYDEALDQYNQAVLDFRTGGDFVNTARALTSIGQLAQQRGRFSEALENYAAAFEELDQAGTPELQSQIFVNSVRANLHRSRADLYRELGQFALAEEDLSFAESFIDFDDLYSMALLSFSKGELNLERGRYEDAVFDFQSVEQIATNITTRNFLIVPQIQANLPVAYLNGIACLGLSDALTSDGDPENVSIEQSNANCAIDVFRNQVPNPYLAIRAYITLADSNTQINIQQAEAFYRRAIQEAVDARSPIGEAYARADLAEFLTTQVRYREGLQEYNQALTKFEQTEDWVGQGDILQRTAAIELRQGAYNIALDLYARAEALYNINADPIREAGAIALIGEIHQQRLRYDLALDAFLRAQETLDNADPSTLPTETSAPLLTATRIRVLRNLATVQLQLGQIEAADTNIQDAALLVVDTTDELEQASIALVQGQIAAVRAASSNALLADAQYSVAIDLFTQAVEVFSGLDEPALWAQAAVERGNVYLTQASRNRDSNLATLANLDFQDAIRESQEANAAALNVEARRGLGRVRLQQGSNQQSQELLESALLRAETLRDDSLIAALRTDLGLLFERQGRAELAIEQYQLAVELIEDIHADLRLQSAQILFIAENILPYHRLVKLYSDSGNTELAFEYAERGRSRTFLFELFNENITLGSSADRALLEERQLKQTELIELRTSLSSILDQEQANLNDQGVVVDANVAGRLNTQKRETNDLITQVEAQLTELDERISTQSAILGQLTRVTIDDLSSTQAALADGAAMLVYYVVPATSFDAGNAYAFLITNNSARVTTLNFEQDNLSVAIQDLRTSYQQFNIVFGDELPTRLLGSIADQLTDEITNLVIVPHAQLNYVPIAVLPYTAADGTTTTLIDRYEVNYVQSATLYNYLEQNVNTNRSLDARPLILGNPETPTREGRFLAPLPSAEAEARALEEEYGIVSYIGSEATETRVINEAGNADLIHIAAHGVLDPIDPLSSYLALSGDNASDGDLTVREIYNLDLRFNNPLVVLSACDTLSGELYEGNEFQNLTRGFLISGARTVVATLWQVDDAATAFLMTNFHEIRQSNADLSDAQALQQAQQLVRDNTDNPQWADPYYWGAFVLVGLP